MVQTLMHSMTSPNMDGDVGRDDQDRSRLGAIASTTGATLSMPAARSRPFEAGIQSRLSRSLRVAARVRFATGGYASFDRRVRGLATAGAAYPSRLCFASPLVALLAPALRAGRLRRRPRLASPWCTPCVAGCRLRCAPACARLAALVRALLRSTPALRSAPRRAVVSARVRTLPPTPPAACCARLPAAPAAPPATQSP